MNNSPNDQLKKNDDEIDLLELFHVLLQGKWIIVSVTAFASIWEFFIVFPCLIYMNRNPC